MDTASSNAIPTIMLFTTSAELAALQFCVFRIFTSADIAGGLVFFITVGIDASSGHDGFPG